MDILDILQPLGRCFLSSSEMAIDEGDEGGVDLHEEHNSPLIAQVILEASLDLRPLMLINPVKIPATDKDKRSNANHIIAGKMHKRLTNILPHIIQMLLNNLLPLANDSLIITNEDIKRTQLNHFLQAHHHHISLIHRKVEQLIEVTYCYLLGVNCVAVPG